MFEFTMYVYQVLYYYDASNITAIITFRMEYFLYELFWVKFQCSMDTQYIALAIVVQNTAARPSHTKSILEAYKWKVLCANNHYILILVLNHVCGSYSFTR